jgi:hypothetical protein
MATDLRGPQAGFDERRQGLQAGEEGGGWLLHRSAGICRCRQIDQPLRQGLGPVEGKHGAGAGLRVQAVGEVGFDAGGFKTERQRPAPGGQAGRQALGVAGGLHFHAGEGGALFLGLDHAGGFGVDVEQVVGKAVAGVQGEFADGHATGGVDVGIRHVADVPAGRSKKRVDGLSRPGLRCHACAPLLRLILGEPRGLRAARSAGRRGATALSSPHCPSGG